MPDKHLHIVAFDIPYPPNYGGVIDVFYKLKALHKKGIKIILHCYEYPGRDRSDKLNEFCEEVYYYPRILGIRSALSFKPYIVASRRSETLIKNLTNDNYPILFEGLHSCYYLDDKRLKGRFLVYRESNIEHRYYFSLARVDKNLFKKIYFMIASIKLRIYQRVLKHASLMLAVSEKDTNYLQGHFPGGNVVYLPSFHANDSINSMTGMGDYALYNGNIEVPENAHAVKYLIEQVFAGSKLPLVIAGMNPPKHILKIAEHHSNVSVIANPSDEKMFDLIKHAHVNILVTFQATGLKLKLLNTLYRGRFCLVNDKMLNGTGLDELCEIANDPSEQKKILNMLFEKEYKTENINKRKEVLNIRYSNDHNANKLIGLVFGT
ncbi:MAG: glycosyltransferase family 1 protein [Bacteroidales bacterium]|nr:glycosyltransferase family 1 protein [Bacteroidales bacterium]